MEAIRIEDGTAVRIMWKDSSTRTGWQYEVAPAAGRIVSLGYVTGTNEDAIQISTSINEEWTYLNPLAIPWGAVEGLTLLGEEWNRNA